MTTKKSSKSLKSPKPFGAPKHTVSLRNFDPENEDFGSDILTSKTRGSSRQHGHMEDMDTTVDTSQTLNRMLMEKKYSGQPVSRKDLYEAESYNEADSVDSEMSDSPSEDASDSFSGPTASSLLAEMRQLDETDATAFQLVAAPDASDADKSTHLRNQLFKFNDFVNVRFKLQPLLNAANRFPERKTLSKTRKSTDRVQESLDACVSELDGLLQDMLTLGFAEAAGDGIAIPEMDLAASDNLTIPSTSTSASSSLQDHWNRLTQLDAALDPFARECLQKWHAKTAVMSDLKAKKTFRMLNQDPYQQVEIALQDAERLVKRTHIHRDSTHARLGTKTVVDGEQTRDSTREFADIYDDNDFYQVLLKDWAVSGGSVAGTAADAITTVLVPAKKQHRLNVDPRASKGRKLRYDVHPKLVNYMVPQLERAIWPDTKIDELCVSLLGQMA